MEERRLTDDGLDGLVSLSVKMEKWKGERSAHEEGQREREEKEGGVLTA